MKVFYGILILACLFYNVASDSYSEGLVDGFILGSVNKEMESSSRPVRYIGYTVDTEYIRFPPDNAPVCKETTIIVVDNIEPTVLTMIVGIIYLVGFVECCRVCWCGTEKEKEYCVGLFVGATLSDLS